MNKGSNFFLQGLANFHICFRRAYKIKKKTSRKKRKEKERKEKKRKGKKRKEKSYYSFLISFINPIYPTPPLGQDMTQGQFLSGL